MKKVVRLFVCILVLAILCSNIAFAVSNTSMQTATTISLNQICSGEITSTQPAQYYKFALPSAGKIIIAGTTYMGTYLNLYNANGSDIWSKTCYTNSTTGRCDFSEQLDLTQGTYYLCFSSWGYTGNFSFSISLASANETFAEDQGGSNNGISTANSVNLGKTYNGQIAINDEKDFYKFTLSSSGKITLTGTTYMGTYLNLYNANGVDIWSKTCYTNSTTGRCDFSEQLDLTQGTYYLCFSSWGLTGIYSFCVNSQGSCTHSWDDGTVTKAATCTANGVMIYTCTCCGATKTESISALGHSYNGGKVTKSATCTSGGVMTYTCTRCGATKTDTIPALGHNYVNGVCSRCNAKQSSGFNDVKAGAWYFDAVLYAVDHDLFSGVGNGQFAPNTVMTRAMLVTVLWRYQGSPNGYYNSFSDVKNGQWYTAAVAWASTKGVVSGVGNNNFAPNGTITREQLATILFSFAKMKGISTTDRASLSKFPDGNKTSSWAKEAVQWAVAKGLLSGSVVNGKTYLDPQGSATRAQVAAVIKSFIENLVH